MADLFQRALMASWLKYGDRRVGLEAPELLNYDYRVVSSRGEETYHYNLWPYLADEPIDGWMEDPKTLATELELLGLDLLFVGAGAGRWSRFLNLKGLNCTNIDTSQIAIDLMNLRGIDAELMDGEALTYADNTFPLVVLDNDGVVDAVPDPTQMIAEAARVASRRVLVMGYEISKTEQEAITATLTWGLPDVDGNPHPEYPRESETNDYYTHPRDHIDQTLVDLGLDVKTKKSWGELADPGGEGLWGTSWILEALV